MSPMDVDSPSDVNILADSRTRTMDALTAFIATQRSLLARTQSDIGRLRVLKGELSEIVGSSETVSQAVATLGEKLRENSYKLSNALDCALVEPAIEWQAFSGADPTLLTERLNYVQATQHEPEEPPPKPLSSLQTLVKSARKTIVDPVLRFYVAQAPLLAPGEYPTDNPYLHPDSVSEDEEPEEVVVSPAEIKRQQERAKIHELKRRKLEEDQALSLLPRRTRGQSGVHVRKDVEDESADVDIDMDQTSIRPTGKAAGAGKTWPPIVPGESFASMALTRTVRARRPSGRQMEINIEKGKETNRRSICDIHHGNDDHDESNSEAGSVSTAATATIGTASSSTLGKRSRSKGRTGPIIIIPARKPRPPAADATVDCDMEDAPLPTSIPFKLKLKPRKQAQPITQTATFSDDDKADEDFVSDGDELQNKANPPAPRTAYSSSSNSKRASRPKPETYKERWTVSEQHLLEKLLEEVGEGEKNRWQKISIAMNGRRTPRQVASRVQKYFSKLKRFGIE